MSVFGLEKWLLIVPELAHLSSPLENLVSCDEIEPILDEHVTFMCINFAQLHLRNG